MEKNQILSYYLNMENGEKTETENIVKIKCTKKYNNNTFELILNKLKNKYGVEIFLEVKDLNNQDTPIVIFKISFNDDVVIEDYFKYLFFAKTSMQLFLDNYDYFIKTKNIKSCICVYKKSRIYIDVKLLENDFIINSEFLSLNIKKNEKNEKILIDINNYSQLFFNKTYPRTGRLNLCKSYKGTDLEISKLEKFQTLKLETIRKTKKEFIVLDINKENNTAIIIELNKKYTIKDCIIDENDLIYLAEETVMSNAYDCLFMENRLLCKNWKNSRLFQSKN